jgi:hypothetical protein
MYCSTNRAQLRCYIENLAGLFILQTGRSYAAINNWMVMHCTTNRAQLCCYIENLAGLSFYKQGAAMLLLIIGLSCIVLQTGRSYAAHFPLSRSLALSLSRSLVPSPPRSLALSFQCPRPKIKNPPHKYGGFNISVTSRNNYLLIFILRVAVKFEVTIL